MVRCRQVTTGSGELPAHIGHGFDADDRFARATVRKAEAARYAALGSSKADTASGRSMHASPARLIITSGASVPSNRDRDTVMAHAASGDLNKGDSEPQRAQHAQRAPSISLVTASIPRQGQDQAAMPEGYLHRQRQASPQGREAQSAQAPADQSGSMNPEAAQTSGRISNPPHAEAQMSSAYPQQYGMAFPQQHANAVGNAEAVNANLAPASGQVPGSPFPARVDSLSHWGRPNGAQQRASSPQANAFAASQQRGSFELEQGQYARHAGDQET